MLSAADSGNRAAEQELDSVPKLPELAVNVWEYFLELDRARGSSGFGPQPLAYSEIDAWRRLTKQTLDPWELSAILKLDALFLTSQAKPPEDQS